MGKAEFAWIRMFPREIGTDYSPSTLAALPLVTDPARSGAKAGDE